MNQLDDIKNNLAEVADEFKKMQQLLLVFCGLAAIGVLVASIAIFKFSNK